MIIEISGVKTNVEINELSVGVFSKFSIYEKDMSYLPLIVLAEGGLRY